MKVIGITGGIGSGKSTVMNILESKYGAKLLVADKIGYETMIKGCDTYFKMVEEFGKGILTEAGEIDRQKLAAILMSDIAELEKQNRIVHPYVLDVIERKLNMWKNEGQRLAAVESAILVEAGCHAYCDEIWLVTAAKEKRIERLINSRGYTKQKAESFIMNQKSDDMYRKDCDRVIENNGDIENIYKQLDKSIEQLLSM